MSNRLNQEREKRLQPVRYDLAVKELTGRGFLVEILSEKHLRFLFKNQWVTYYPYSGWATGKSIKDGRGLNFLLNQLNP